MANKKQYRLAVEGKRNYTPVGPVFETPFDARGAARRINEKRAKAGLKPVVALKQYSAGRWHFLYYLSLPVLLLALSLSAPAQERPARTWATVGVTLTKSTARESAPAIAGLDVRLAYDLRYGFQAVAEGEYRSEPAIKRLFTGHWPNRAQSEIRYGAKLNYHFRRFQVGGGVSVIRHSFDDPLPPLVGQTLYNSSVNPTISAGVALGKNSQIVFTKYLADTYSYSDLRGWGVDFANTRRVSERVYVRSGAKFKRWAFYEGYGHYDRSAIEVGGFVGFQFQ